MLLPFLRADADAQLVRRASQGDQAAFNALVSRHQAAVVQFVRSRLDAFVDPEDVAQEIFVAAWRQLPRFRGESRFRTWLFGIARNRCAEAARSGRRVESLSSLPEGGEAHVTYPWSEESSDSTTRVEERERVRNWLRGLPDLEREVVELYYFGELNLREIAELSRTNLSTIKTRFYQAHRKLRVTALAEAATGAAWRPDARSPESSGREQCRNAE